MDNKDREPINIGTLKSWLSDENFMINYFKTGIPAIDEFAVQIQPGRSFHVIEPIGKSGKIMILAGMHTEDVQEKLLKLGDTKLNELSYDLTLKIIALHIPSFTFKTTPPMLIQVITFVYYDGLNKNIFMDKVFSVILAIEIINKIISKAIGSTEQIKTEFPL